MDLKYIIAWIVLSIQSAPCPSVNANKDLGVSNSYGASCAVYHTQTVKEKHERVFISKDSAVAFVCRLRDYHPTGWFSNEDKITDIKLDSICK